MLFQCARSFTASGQGWTPSWMLVADGVVCAFFGCGGVTVLLLPPFRSQADSASSSTRMAANHGMERGACLFMCSLPQQRSFVVYFLVSSEYNGSASSPQHSSPTWTTARSAASGTNPC